jgi:ubiquinone/menaquinone biosynthesis C-methylase UbiE
MTADIQSPSYWDAQVDSYVAAGEPFTSHFCRHALTLAGVAPGVRLLDVATGPGALAIAAAADGAIVTAIDFSEAMIARLRTRAGAGEIDARHMDGQALAFADGSFERVCSVFGIPLFPDWQAGLREMHRVLVPGGVAIVAVADNPVGFGPNVLIDRARRQMLPDKVFVHDVSGMQILCDPEKLTRAMQAAGFVDVIITSVTHGFDLGMAFADAGVRLRSHPMLADLSDEDAAAVLGAACRNAALISSTDDGTLPSTALFAAGRKLESAR